MDQTSGSSQLSAVESLLKLARGAAGRLGASGPISIQHVSTTRGESEQLPGPWPTNVSRSRLDPDTPCYVVLIQGTFKPYASPSRPGPAPPEPCSLSSVVLTVHAKTGRIVASRTVFSGGEAPDLAVLGQVTVDATDTTAVQDRSPSDSPNLQEPLSEAEQREVLYLNRQGCLCKIAREMWETGAKGYADAHLVETGVQADGWEVLYRCPLTGADWVLDMPISAEHGGGPSRLRRTS
jgi:hypothetical protein